MDIRRYLRFQEGTETVPGTVIIKVLVVINNASRRANPDRKRICRSDGPRKDKLVLISVKVTEIRIKRFEIIVSVATNQDDFVQIPEHGYAGGILKAWEPADICEVNFVNGILEQGELIKKCDPKIADVDVK